MVEPVGERILGAEVLAPGLAATVIAAFDS
jgi:hypothetical protein